MRALVNIKKLVSREFIRHTATLISGNIIAQAISLLIYPVLTRLYSPDDFGVFNLFLSIGGCIVILSTGAFHYSIILPKQEKDSLTCVRLCAYCIIIATLISLLPAFFKTFTADLFNTTDLADSLIYLPLFVLSGGLWSCINYWFIRQKSFKHIAEYQITLNASNSGLKTVFGIIQSGYGLIIGTIIGQITAISISLIHCKKYFKSFFKYGNFSELRQTASKYADFPRYALPRNLINYFGSNLLVLLLSPYFGMAKIGIFGMAIALSMRPIILINNALSQTITQKISYCIKEHTSAVPMIKKYFKYSIPTIIVGFGVLYLVLPATCSWLLGETWRDAGEYIRLMLPWLACLLWFYPFSCIPDILNKQRTDMLFEITITIVRVIAIIIGIAINDFYITILLYSLLSSLIIIIRGFWFFKLAKTYT